MESILMLDADLDKRVIRLVCARSGVDRSRVNLNSRLVHDLCIDGDDAEELLIEFAEVFRVDMSGFEYGRHFRGEPVLFRRRPPIRSLAPVTLRELIESSRRGRWVGAREQLIP